MKAMIVLLTLLFSHSIAHAAKPVTPDMALEMLLEGNDRFVQGKFTHPFYAAEARDKMLEKQTPFAAIVGCSEHARAGRLSLKDHPKRIDRLPAGVGPFRGPFATWSDGRSVATLPTAA